MARVCVFAGSSPGVRPSYAAAAAGLGRAIAERGLGLVYGGGRVGLMGVVADAALAAGGEVIGVLPRALDTIELAHRGLTALHVVESMHARKALMADLSDAFVALPGGLGTFDELFEICTWFQLGFHRKAVGLLDVDAYFDPLVAMVHHAVEEGFLRPSFERLFTRATSAAVLLDRLLPA